jgi:hypothetical protein
MLMNGSYSRSSSSSSSDKTTALTARFAAINFIFSMRLRRSCSFTHGCQFLELVFFLFGEGSLMMWGGMLSMVQNYVSRRTITSTSSSAGWTTAPNNHTRHGRGEQSMGRLFAARLLVVQFDSGPGQVFHHGRCASLANLKISSPDS